MPSLFLPTIPEQYILDRLAKAGGNEIKSGKIASKHSSAALAIDVFGAFILEPSSLPVIPGLKDVDWPPIDVDIEYCARFPWSRGRHPWLDAVVRTKSCLIGVESKRFEPYRDKKRNSFAKAYDDHNWGSKMEPYVSVKDALKSGELRYTYLDAAQLVKHAFGLHTDSILRNKGVPYLLYIYITTEHKTPVTITSEMARHHIEEVNDFARRVQGGDVRFMHLSYENWLANWPSKLSNHRAEVAVKYQLVLA